MDRQATRWEVAGAFTVQGELELRHHPSRVPKGEAPGAPAFCGRTHFPLLAPGPPSYDEFNRLTSTTVYNGTPQNFTYLYDRYSNRWQQTVTAGSGPQPQFSFNTSNNQITNSGFAYDAAGNMTNDTVHTYKYDAEGNIITVDNGSTAQYTYNALNQRVQTVTSVGTREFVYNLAGQRVSIWNGSNNTQTQGQYYWGRQPVALYEIGQTWFQNSSETYFQHQDWEGTERARTTYNGSVEGTYTDLVFGDAHAASGNDFDAYHYGMLDHDYETSTEHAQFRQCSSSQGRMMSPDPYGGSYDPSNPQSFNRYAYALNNPVSAVDPSGLNLVMQCDGDGNCVTYDDGQGTVDDGYGNGFDGYDCDAADTACVDGGAYPDIDLSGTPGPGAPNNGSYSLFQQFECAIGGTVGGVAKATGLTAGIGIGGSAGLGIKIFGVSISLSGQLVADPQGNVGFAGSLGANVPGIVVGAGAVGGVQGSLSTTQNISGLAGPSVDFGVGGGEGLGGALDVSAGVNGNGLTLPVTGTVTAGGGVGGFGGALTPTVTGVVGKTNCKGIWGW